MVRRFGLIAVIACALTVVAVSSGAAQPVTGTVARIDQHAGVVVLDDGRMYQVTPHTVVLVNTQPTAITAIAPGTPVVFHSAQPVAFRDGHYVVLPHSASDPHAVSGVVRWVGASEPGRSSLTLESGQQIWIDESTQVLVNGAPAMMSTLRPGEFVVVRSAKPLAMRDRSTGATADPGATVVMPATVVDSPSAMPGSRPYAGSVIYPHGASAFPSAQGPVYPEMGLRQQENERQAP